MADAGYPEGRDVETGRPLVLNYDFYALPTPERKIEIDWVVRQFAKLNIQLEVRATDNNQFQDKIRKGKHQVYWTGWNADYPDAENFMQLLYGPSGPENNARFDLPAFNQLYERARTLPDGPERTKLFDRMTELVVAYAPFRMTYHLLEDNVHHPWVKTYVAHPIRSETWQYVDIDPALRAR